MATLAKPYSFDLLMALALLVPAAHWLDRPELRWLALLCLVAPIAACGSYPSVFVGGAVSIALLPSVWRDRRLSARLLLVAYSGLLMASFLGHFLIVGRATLQTPTNGVTTDTGMKVYWADGFPPAAPWPLLKWLVLTHTGQMTAYPVGASNGGSALTALLCLVGAVHLWKVRRRALLALCVAPFVLWLGAATLHRYPYGASCRLSQHAASLICLLAGLGAAVWIGRLRSATERRRWAVGVCSAFLVLGVGGMVRDTIRPYRDRGTQWMYQEMRELEARIRPGAAIMVQQHGMDAVFRWYLGLHADQVSWGGKIDWQRAAAAGEVLYLHFRWRPLNSSDQLGSPMRAPAVPPAELAAQFTDAWHLQTAITDTNAPNDPQDLVTEVDQFDWVLDAPTKESTLPPGS
jgi:hypothetical protein